MLFSPGDRKSLKNWFKSNLHFQIPEPSLENYIHILDLIKFRKKH